MIGDHPARDRATLRRRQHLHIAAHGRRYQPLPAFPPHQSGLHRHARFSDAAAGSSSVGVRDCVCVCGGGGGVLVRVRGHTACSSSDVVLFLLVVSVWRREPGPCQRIGPWTCQASRRCRSIGFRSVAAHGARSTAVLRPRRLRPQRCPTAPRRSRRRLPLPRPRRLCHPPRR